MLLSAAPLLLAALPNSGAAIQARATAHIVAAEEIDFARPEAETGGSAALFRLVTRRANVAGAAVENSLQLVEFQ